MCFFFLFVFLTFFCKYKQKIYVKWPLTVTICQNLIDVCDKTTLWLCKYFAMVSLKFRCWSMYRYCNKNVSSCFFYSYKVYDISKENAFFLNCISFTIVLWKDTSGHIKGIKENTNKIRLSSPLMTNLSKSISFTDGSRRSAKPLDAQPQRVGFRWLIFYVI